MRKIKNILLLFSILIACVLLSACGGDLKTSLVIDSDFKGSRVMELYINKSENQQYIKSDQDTITQSVQESLPKDLKLDVSDDGTNVIYKFTLDFESKEDYEKKLRNILPTDEFDSDTQLVTYITPKSVFTNGMKIEEKFSSKDLLKWFEDLIVDKGYIEESNKSHIFDKTSNTLNYNGQDLELSTYMTDIVYDNLEYCRINSINFFTNIKGYDIFDRKIVISVPQSSINKKGKEIEEYLKSKAESAEFEKDKAGDNTIFTITAKDMDAVKLDKFTNNFTGQKDAKGFTLLEDKVANVQEAKPEEAQEKETKAEETKPEETKKDSKEKETKADKATKEEKKEIKKGNRYIFYSRNKIQEDIDLQEYIGGDYEAVQFGYYVNSDAAYKNLKNDSDDISYYADGIERNAYLDFNEGMNDKDLKKAFENNKYASLFTGYAIDFKIGYTCYNSYEIKELNIKTHLRDNGTYVRNVDISYKQNMSDEAFENIKSLLENNFEGLDIELKNVEKTDDGFKVSLEEDTKDNKLENKWNSAFDIKEGGSNTEYYIENIKGFKKQIDFKDSFNLLNLTNKNIEKINYEVSNVGKRLLNDEHNIKHGKYKATYENVKVNNSDETVDSENIKNAYLVHEIRSIRTSKLLYISYLIIILIALIIILLIFRLIKMLGKNKDNAIKDPEVSEQNNLVSEDKEYMFCGSCGSKNEKGEKFCGSCGAKLE